MRALQKLVRNGNATRVAIPRQLLIHLGWLPGEMLTVELLEDRTIRLRRPVLADLAPLGPPQLLPLPLDKVAV